MNRVALTSIALFLATPVTVLAQNNRKMDAGDLVAGMTCWGICFLIVVAPIVYTAINIAILFWMAKDAKSRGMDGAMWIFLVLFTGVLGLGIYLFSRPQGLLMQCNSCGNNRLEASAKCPHCGHA